MENFGLDVAVLKKLRLQRGGTNSALKGAAKPQPLELGM
jgi:hypothetical protein